MPPRPFQLMIGSRDGADAPTIAERARFAESIGATHVAVHDHLGDQYAPIPTLTAYAMASERLGLVPLVFNNDLRHPALLAHELASLDVLSRGRVVVGIGAGWNEPEYRRLGIPFDRPGIRIERMTEAIAILRGAFGEEPFSFTGKHYTIEALDGQPKPVQQPHPPFLVGGTRERVLRAATQQADIVGLDLRQQGEAILDAFEARTSLRVGWIREEAGDRIERLDINVLRTLGKLTVRGNPLRAAEDVAARYRQSTGQEISAEDILESPFSLIGTVPSLVEKLRRQRERWGINSLLVGWFDEPELRDLAPVIEQLSGR